MTKTNLSPQVFKRVMDFTPSGVNLWRHIGDPQKWQGSILLYLNEELIKMAGPGFNQVGHPAGEIVKGLEKTGFNEVFMRAIATGEPQEFNFHFGNENVKECDWQMYFSYLPQSYLGVFVTDITARVHAENVKAEKAKNLEEMNQKLVERELQMIQLKSEIMELEGKVEKKG